MGIPCTMIDQSDVNSVTNDIVSLRELVSAFLLTNFPILPRRTTMVDACFTRYESWARCLPRLKRMFQLLSVVGML